MNESVKIQASLLVRNTSLNFIGHIISASVAVVTIPYVINGLGMERFGILSLAWAVFLCFSLFDLGLGRATTKFVAEALAKGEMERIATIAWTSLALVFLLSLTGAIIFLLLTPMLVGSVLNVPKYLIDETRLVFYVFSVSILTILILTTLSGVLEAYQRFDLVNLLRVPSNILNYIIPVLALIFGGGLPTIVLLWAIKNLCMAFTYFIFCFSFMPKTKPYLDLSLVRTLLGFGGWLTVMYIANTVVMYLDRFLIGSLLSMAAVSFYTVPFDALSYLCVLPGSLCATLLPAFSAIGIYGKEPLAHLFARASKYLILSSGVIVLIIVLFADKILLFWLGKEFVQNSTRVFQILAIGFFLNIQAWIPIVLLQGIGRPDVVAKIVLLELPLCVSALWWLIGKMGIEGAALAWALRGGLELISYHAVCWKIVRFSFSVFVRDRTFHAIMALGGLVTASIMLKFTVAMSWLGESFLTVGLLIVFGLVVWRLVLDLDERASLVKLVKILPWQQKVAGEAK